MIRVALVGNIASGKSTVEAILQQFGYLVLDTDKVCHKLLENNSEIIEAFSSYDILDENQNISREKLGKIVFVAIPLLFEANMQDLFDKILFVYTNDEIRLERLIARNKYTKEYAQIRLNSQLSQDEKVKKSDYVIYNNSTKGELKEKVLKVFEQIR